MAAVPPLSTILAPQPKGRNLSWAFSLGGVPFDRFAVPEELKLGVEIETKTHKYITERGRARIRTHTQGAFLIETNWKGVFNTSQALPRARTLQNLASQGKPVELVYGPNKWSVIIKKFHYTVYWQYEVHYDIDVQIVEDKNGLELSPETSGFDAVADLRFLAAQGGFADMLTGDPFLPPTLIAAQASATTALNSAYPLRTQSFPTLFNLTQQLDKLNGEFVNYVKTKTGSALATSLAQMAVAQLTQASYTLLNRAIKKLVGASGVTAQTVTSATSLIAVASQFYPKADPVSTAQFLAQANSFTSFFIPAGTLVKLPPLLGTNAKS